MRQTTIYIDNEKFTVLLDQLFKPFGDQDRTDVIAMSERTIVYRSDTLADKITRQLAELVMCNVQKG